MPSPIYEDMTIPQLEAEKVEIDKVIKNKKKTAKADFLKQCKQLAKDQGLDFDDVVKGKAAKKASTPPKYRNTEDSTQTWVGKGRKPKWLDDALASGKALESFAL